jgi:hypothetical protein
MFLTLIKPVSDKWVIEQFNHTLPMRSCATNRKFRCEGLIAVKIPPEEGVITSIFRRNYKAVRRNYKAGRRNYKADLSYVVDIPPGEKDILILAGKFNDIKRFSES